MRQQPRLAVQAAAVAGERAARADNAMARDHDGDGVGAVGAPDRTDRFRVSEPPREIADSEKIKKLVASNPHYIGYIDRSALDASVKIVLAVR